MYGTRREQQVSLSQLFYLRSNIRQDWKEDDGRHAVSCPHSYICQVVVTFATDVQDMFRTLLRNIISTQHWRQCASSCPNLQAYNRSLVMLTQEERSLIPLVSKWGCVDIRALRHAFNIVKNQPVKKVRDHLFMYYYLKATDPDQDEPMMDFED